LAGFLGFRKWVLISCCCVFEGFEETHYLKASGEKLHQIQLWPTITNLQEPEQLALVLSFPVSIGLGHSFGASPLITVNLLIQCD
jgi:hypothetical protein